MTIRQINRNVSIIIFYDTDGNIAIQKRGSYSKLGEKYGYWGGGIEPNETPLEAIVREAKEELNISLDNPEFFSKYSYDTIYKDQHWFINVNVFITPLTPDVINAKVNEGDAIEVVSIDEAVKLLPRFDTSVLIDLRKRIG